MAIRKVITEGDETLRKKSKPVVDFDDRLGSLLDDMRDTMYKYEGAGLAAVQVGVLKQAFVMDTGHEYRECINPEIVKEEGTDTFGITHGSRNSATSQVRTAAQDCFLVPENWDVLGSHADPGTKNSALITKVNYGKGMYFFNQILFPEVDEPEAERAFAFWKKYIPNLPENPMSREPQ